jgi:diguanylate cyclase (GGDEF)-like protein/PAS domain S-box-containing protein
MSDNTNKKDDAQFYSDLLRAFFDSANDAIFVLCDEMKFLICNKMTQQWLGSSEDVLTQHNERIPITELLGNPDSIDYFKSSFRRALNNEEVFFETLINPLSGKSRWIELSMKRVNIEEGDMVIVVARDITQRKKNIAAIEYKTNYDHLTNLPNRNFLVNSILNDTSSSFDQNQLLTLISIDLDRFKEINESLGQQVGDFVLQRVANRLYKAIDHTSDELLARLEGDEFVLIFPNTETARAHEIAIRIKQIVSKPIAIGSSRISVDCSIGIASFPEHTTNKHALIQYAESAMYTAKANRRGIGIYDAAIHRATTEKLRLITQLRSAISEKLIIPHYQPIINMKNPEQVRVESLARWKHITLGNISPETFIRFAEEVGSINSLTSIILSRSIHECSSLLNDGKIKSLSINISPHCLANPKLVDEIKGLLDQYSVSPDKIILEITESAMMSNLGTTGAIINELHQLGINFSIDDFGTGHSSLVKLKQLPLSELKIDKSFVLDINSNENDSAICHASIQMAHTLGLEVVAEGIEQQEIWDMLRDMGCDYGQGFWMSKAMPYDELVAWLESSDKIFQ